MSDVLSVTRWINSLEREHVRALTSFGELRVEPEQLLEIGASEEGMVDDRLARRARRLHPGCPTGRRLAAHAGTFHGALPESHSLRARASSFGVSTGRQ